LGFNTLRTYPTLTTKLVKTTHPEVSVDDLPVVDIVTTENYYRHLSGLVNRDGGNVSMTVNTLVLNVVKK